MDHITKENLSWSRTRAKFYQLIAGVSVFISFCFCAESQTWGPHVWILSV